MKTALYIHVPFCVSKCKYCNFVSYSDDGYGRYCDALVSEISLLYRKYGFRDIDTIYFGGGTPSLLPVPEFQKVLLAVRMAFNVRPDCEISMELNPNSATPYKIASFVKCGVNRFSVGLQCPNDAILTSLGRPHNTQDFCDTVEALQKCGIKNINADVILGLPNQTKADLDRTLELVDKYDLPHLSAYALKVEKGTPLFKEVKSGLKLPDDDFTVEMYDYLQKQLRKRSIFRYEISNFARKGYECRHNLIYWNYDQYLAAGMSASGFALKRRYVNVDSFDKYYSLLDSGKLPTKSVQKLTTSDQQFEYVMLGLRKEEGFELKDFYLRFGCDFLQAYEKTAPQLIAKGCIKVTRTHVKIPSSKMYVQNEILVDLLF